MTGAPRTVAILHTSNFLEDWLDPLGVSIDDFHREMVGSWLFGYVGALRTAGIGSVLVSVSTRIDTPVHRVHEPTGASHRILPAPVGFRLARRVVPRRAGPGRSIGSGVTAALLGTPVRLLAGSIREEGCDALLVQDYEHIRFDLSILVGRSLDVPVYASFQGNRESRRALVRRVRGASIRAAAGLITPDRDEARRVRTRYGLTPARIARIFNPVDSSFWGTGDRADCRRSLGLPGDRPVVAWHGRVDFEYKGVDVLLDAWEKIAGRGPGPAPILLLVGMGADAERLRSRIARLPAGSVRWIDRWVHDREKLLTYLTAADIYVFPSRIEGFPVSPLEAMACGLPVVAADANGIADIFESGEASGGIVVPVGDSSALAEGLRRLLDSPAHVRELGGRARRRIEEAFSPRVVGRQLACFLSSDPRPDE